MTSKLTVSLAKPIAATLLAGIAVTFAVPLSATAQQTGSGTAINNGTTNDLARCRQLYLMRNKYESKDIMSSNDAGAELAYEKCKAGHVDAGIAEIEAMIRKKGIALPRPETARSR